MDNIQESYQFFSKSQYKKWATWKEGDFIIGEYAGETVDPTYDKPVYNFILFASQFQDGTQLKTGELMSLNHNGSIERGMERYAVGDVVKVEYLGVEKLTEGKYKGKDSHRVRVVKGIPKKRAVESSDVPL